MESNNTIWLIIRRMRVPFLVIIITFSISILGMVLIPGVDDQGKPYQLSFFDAFYFVSYMASTIGFGEAPYTFTYPQRLWVSFCIYLTVIGWFYGIGSLVALVQDKRLSREMDISRFRGKIEDLDEPFSIILGYNNVTHEIINRLNMEGIRVVVVDKSEEKVNALDLENFIPEVPALTADVTKPETIKLAGIHKKSCEAVVSLFEDDVKNTKIALLCKLLNKNVRLVVKSTTKTQTEHLRNLGVRYIEDPFKFISDRLYLALTAESLWLLEMWIFGHVLKVRKREKIPSKGKYIICGYGRMGRALEEALKKANLEYAFIDIKSEEYKKKKKSAVFGDTEDHQMLINAGIKEASAIIAATKDDLINLTILATAKKLNKNIYTIGRENTMDDISIFRSARINRIYILEQVLAEFTYLFIARPLAYKFVKLLHNKDEKWGKNLVNLLKEKVSVNPIHFEIEISEKSAYALYHKLKDGEKINLGTIKRSREDWKKDLNLVFLLCKFEQNDYLVLPKDEVEIKIGAKLLIASTEEAKVDFEYIINNYYELEYVMTGK